MASEKTYSLDLSGGVTCDAEKFSLAISDSENLVKPIGGAAQGLRVRGGQTYFDNVASVIGPGDNGVIAIAAALNPAEGYPAGSVATILVNTETSAIVDMQIGISKYGISSDETDLEPTLIPIGMSLTNALFVTDSDSAWCVVGYDPAASDFIYTGVQQSLNSTNGAQTVHVTNDAKLVYFGFPNAGGLSVAVWNWARMRERALLSNGFNTGQKTSTNLQVAYQAGFSVNVWYGNHWISRGNVFYQMHLPTNGHSYKIMRVNINTGALIGFVTVALPVLAGSTTVNFATTPASRPDANGDVIIPYRTNNSQRGVAKVNPATGAVTASLDITATVPAWDLTYSSIVPMSTGTYLFHAYISSVSSRWFVLNAGLTTCTEILVGTGTVTHRGLPLLGGSSDTAYYAKQVGAGYRLHTISAVSTAPVATTASVDLPAFSNVAVAPVDLADNGDVSLYGHCRLDATTMMYGKWGKVNLTTGVTTLLTRGDRFSNQVADNELLGGSNYNMHSATVNPDPARWLLNLEGFRESV